MSYKDRFLSSEGKALNKIIATKIDRDMRVLRSSVESSKAAPRRWIWELIQNAKDVHQQGERVRIQINYDNKDNDQKLIFKHNGKPFTADNIRFLIEQISSKERTLNEDGKPDSTGKFGTGFLSTHLLSETVKVHGVAKEPELEPRKFEMTLDRSGLDLDQISLGVEQAKTSISNLDELPSFDSYDSKILNTSFNYPLIDSISQSVAQKGLDDLNRSVFFMLLFVKEIAEIHLLHENIIYRRVNFKELESEIINIVEIEVINATNHSLINKFEVACLKKNHTTVALPISKENGLVRIQPLDENVPRLFCDFPLVGTESFPFPLIINNPLFNPTDPRDGVFLNEQSRSNPLIEQNIKIINEAIEMYLKVLENAASNKWLDIHLLANIQPLKVDLDWVSERWHLNNVLSPIRKKILHAQIVNTASGGELVSILDDSNKKYVWFPSSSNNEIRQQIWYLANDWFPYCLPKQSEVDLWYKLTWNECGKLTTKQFSEFIQSKRSINNLNDLKNGKEIHEWLNEFYSLIHSDSKDYDSIINQFEIFPDQNGNFHKKTELHIDKGDIGDDLKEILLLLGKDIKSELSDSKIENYHLEPKSRDRNFVVKEISSTVLLKHSNQDESEDYKEACQMLLKWFKDHPDLANIIFPDLFKRKHILYDEEIIIENMDKAEQLQVLLDDYGAESLVELKSLLDKKTESEDKLFPLTEDILSSLGISSIEEWQKAMEDKDIAALFSHESTPSEDMFLFVQSMISKAKTKIIDKLHLLDEYNLSEIEETAPTVLSGITKNGIAISIVARPAYTGEVILYYGAERDVLDFEHSELWVDDGVKQRSITLGHILKKTGIRKFPI